MKKYTKIFFLIASFLAFKSVVKAQDFYMEPKSDLFDNFVCPSLPKDLYNLQGPHPKYDGMIQMAFFVKIRTDSTGRTVNVTLDRLLNFSTDGLFIPDSVWKQGEDSIISVSHDWIVSPDLKCIEEYKNESYCRIRSVYLIVNYVVSDFDKVSVGNSVYVEVY